MKSNDEWVNLVKGIPRAEMARRGITYDQLAAKLAELGVQTMRRAALRQELYSGNRETFRRAFLSRDSILWWVVTTHRQRQRQYPALFARPEFRHLDVLELETPWQATRFLRHRHDAPAERGET
jgi:hypothetical protein